MERIEIHISYAAVLEEVHARTEYAAAKNPDAPYTEMKAGRYDDTLLKTFAGAAATMLPAVLGRHLREKTETDDGMTLVLDAASRTTAAARHELGNVMHEFAVLETSAAWYETCRDKAMAEGSSKDAAAQLESAAAMLMTRTPPVRHAEGPRNEIIKGKDTCRH